MRDRVLGDRHVAAGGQPAQAHREEQDQQDAEEEGRDRRAGDRDHRHDRSRIELWRTAAITPAGMPISDLDQQARRASAARSVGRGRAAPA